MECITCPNPAEPGQEFCPICQEMFDAIVEGFEKGEMIMEFKKFKYQVDTYNEEEMVCPYCGAVQEGWFCDSTETGEDFDIECQNPKCKKTFGMTPEITYTTVRLGDDGLEDDDRPLSEHRA